MRLRTNILYRLVLLPFTCFPSDAVGTRKLVSLPHTTVQAVSGYKNMLRLRDVVGYSGRQDNMLFVPGDSANDKKKHVIFFPGDVQNYRETMASHFSNHKAVKWCYENTATLLASKFPQAWIWLVEPNKMHDGIFSCYDNFLTSNLLGASENFDNHNALLHLQILLSSAVHVVNNHADDNEGQKVCDLEQDTCENSSQSSGSVTDINNISVDLPVIIVGFSKGCVVLNQFLHKLQQADDNPELKKFIGKISAWYWVDGGHSKDTDTWITNEDVLKNLANLKTKLQVLVTPYQVKDKNRPYIEEEERSFVDTLRSLGAEVTEVLHFAEEERSFGKHFKVLEKLFDVSE